MATYFHHNTADIQQGHHDGLHTLVLMNPTYVQYSTDAPPPQPPQTNLLFLNSTATPSTLLHAPPPHPHPHPHHHPHPQQFVGIPIPSTATASDPNSPSIHHGPQHDLSSMHGLVPRVHYNVWNTLDPSVAAREASRSQGGLSLSLSSQQPGFGSFRNERDAHHAPPQDAGTMRDHEVPISGESPSSASGVTNGVSGVQSVLVGSKYLKAAQELLDEVVNVGSGIKTAEAMLKRPNNKAAADGESSAAKEDESSGGRKSGGELTTAERQEIQMKKAKLINMLDEVEQRYRQYHHQMHIVISSFEHLAGIGSARTYTALALQTISKQFRCLKDAITGQIRSANKSLGEEDSPGGKLEGSRLKFVDHHIRQQRALQQLGMIQHNAWRPQRGLPERSVSILRAWLFEHFLHPYPKDSDKHLLAKQTGLTRSQVSNWFINARVRLWKPMVEDMYMEEVKEQGLNNGGDDKTSKSEHNEDSTSKSSGPQDNAPNKNHVKNFKENGSINQEAPVLSPHSTSSVGGNVRNQSGFALIGSTELEGIKQGSPKRPRNIDMLHSPNSFTSMNVEINQGETNNDQVSLKFPDDRQSRDGYSIVAGPTNFIGGLGQYPISEIGRFGAEQFAPTFPGNSVSLTLGLPHSDLSLSGAPQNFLPSQNIQLGRRVDIGDANEFGAINTSIPHSSTAFDGIDIQDRKRFAAQLLPDFVA